MRKLTPQLVCLVLFLTLTSCVKNLDFDQIKDYTTKQAFIGSIVYFTLDQNDFYDAVNSVEITTPITDDTKFNLLNNDFIRKNLQKMELVFEINNNFNREFTVNVTFLDENNKETHVFRPFNIQANQTGFKQTEEINVAGNTQFLSSKKIRVGVTLSASNTGTIDPNIKQTLEVKSAGTFYIKTSPFN